MELMTILWTVWGILTGILVVLLIYRSTLTIHEDDQLFLDQAESHMEKEQADLQRKLTKIRPVVNLLGACSAVLILAIAAVWVYRGWSGM